MGQEPAVPSAHQAASPVKKFSRDQIDLIKRQIIPGADDDDMKMFLYVCARAALDPFARQIFPVPRNVKEIGPGGKAIWRKKYTYQTSIDGLRLIAERSGAYAGSSDPEFGPDSTEETLNITKPISHPEWARVRVQKMLPTGGTVSYTGVVRWSEFRQVKEIKHEDPKTKKWVGSGAYEYMGLWEDKPYHMLAKCAEAHALRKGFPQEMAGLYTKDELPELREAVSVAEPARKSEQIAQQPPKNKAHKHTPWHDKLYEAVLAAVDGNKEQAAFELERATTYRDDAGNIIPGERDIQNVDPTVAEWAVKRLEAESAPPAAAAEGEPSDAAPKIDSPFKE